jgi:hypothetical protein
MSVQKQSKMSRNARTNQGSVRERSEHKRSARRTIISAVVALTAFAVAGVAIAANESTKPAPPPASDADLGSASHTIATGSAEIAGRWRMFWFTGTEERLGPEQDGLPCLGISLQDPPPNTPLLANSVCGTTGDSGFSASSLPVRNAAGNEQLLLYGRAPASATSVKLSGGTTDSVHTLPSGTRALDGRVWAMPVAPGVRGDSLSWTRADGSTASTSMATGDLFQRLDQLKRMQTR